MGKKKITPFDMAVKAEGDPNASLWIRGARHVLPAPKSDWRLRSSGRK